MNKIKYSVRVLPEVLGEVIDAIQWYHKISPNLSRRLKSEIKSAFNKIRKNPAHYQIRYDWVRLFHLRIFPYSFHYEHYEIDEEENQVSIIAFLHQHKRNRSRE